MGDDYSCMVLETVDGVIPLRPIINKYPKSWKPEDCFLDWEAKCAPLMEEVGKDKEIVGYKKEFLKFGIF